MTSGGYGQQNPTVNTDRFNGISFVVRQMIERLETMKLVQVKGVSGSGTIAAPGTVDVQPMVSQIDGAGNGTPHGTVFGIPWFRVQAGTCAVICDPKPGDVGFVVVSDRDISSVKKTGKPGTPASFRKFSLADGVYVGGLLGAIPKNYLLLKDDKVELHFDAYSVVIDAAGIHLNGPIFFNGLATGATLGAAVDFGASPITTTGLVTSNGKVLSTHIHSGVTAGAGNTGGPV